MPAPAGATPPWQSAERIRSEPLRGAELVVAGWRCRRGGEGRARPPRPRRRARARPQRHAPSDLRAVRHDLAAARAAAPRGDEVALAAARGRIVAALRRGAYAVTLDATRSGNVPRARAWLLVRDFRQATRFTRPGVDATAALEGLAARDIDPRDAAIGVKKDLLDAYQSRLLTYLDEAEQALERSYGAALAENAALAAGYWPILADEYERQRGAAQRRSGGSRLRGPGSERRRRRRR